MTCTQASHEPLQKGIAQTFFHTVLQLLEFGDLVNRQLVHTPGVLAEGPFRACE